MVTFLLISWGLMAIAVVVLGWLLLEASESLSWERAARIESEKHCQSWRTRYNNLWNCLDDLSLMDADDVPKGLEVEPNDEDEDADE